MGSKPLMQEDLVVFQDEGSLGGVPVRRHIVWYLRICMHNFMLQRGPTIFGNHQFLFRIES